MASGGGSLAAAILEAQDAGQLDLECVGLVSDKQSPVLDIARRYGIPDFYLPMRSDRTQWDQEIFDRAQGLSPDLIVSVGFMRILAPQ